MSIELKSEIFKQRIGELVSSYENRVADLRIANTYLAEEKSRLEGVITELEERLRQYVAEPQQEEYGENRPEDNFPVLDSSTN